MLISLADGWFRDVMPDILVPELVRCCPNIKKLFLTELRCCTCPDVVGFLPSLAPCSHCRALACICRIGPALDASHLTGQVYLGCLADGPDRGTADAAAGPAGR